MLLHILCVVALEITVMRLMKVDHDRHHLAFAQVASSLALPPLSELLLTPLGFKCLPEIIDGTEQFQ